MKSRKKIVQQLRNNWGKVKEDHFNFDQIQKLFQYKSKQGEAFLLTKQTVDDLDFHPFFKFIDRTNSAIGQQYLYAELRKLNQDKAYLTQLENDIQHYGSDKEHCLKIQKELIQVSDTIDYFFPFLIYGDLPPKIKYIWLIKMLQLLVFMSITAAFFFPPISILLVFLFAASLFLHYWNKKRIGNFVQVFSRLSKLTQVSKALLPYSNKGKTQKQEIEEAIKTVEKLTANIILLKADNLQSNEIASAVWYAFEIIKIITVSEILLFHKVVHKIDQERSKMALLYHFIGAVDVAVATASLRSSLPHYSIPKFTAPQKGIDLKQVYHPLVEGCVANDLRLDHKSLLLTGSNMSGKSTFVKALNLNLIAAQVLNTSFAKSYTAPFFKIATSIKISDNILENRSYFMEEVHSVGQLIERSEDLQSQYLFTIDELFKGTNTIERISSAKAILEFLNKGQHIVLVSTHDIELTLLLKDGYDMHFFQESIEDESLSFDYKLQAGALKKRNAINILALMSYPEVIVAEAKALATRFEDEKTGQKTI